VPRTNFRVSATARPASILVVRGLDMTLFRPATLIFREAQFIAATPIQHF
jgi:hypothetical protein